MAHDVIIIGLGAMGSAAAYELARRGYKVLGLEQYPFVHDRGSSHGQTRIIRTAYFEHPAYVPLAQRSFARWYDLEQRSGKHLLTECGCLNIGLPDSELIGGVTRAAEKHRLAVEHLHGDDIGRRFPALRFGPEYVGILERQAGFLYVEECVRTHLEQAQALGAELHAEEQVHAWTAMGGSVEVHTGQTVYHAKKLVIAAGAWASRVLVELGLPLVVRRKALLWFAASRPELLRRDVFPVYLSNTLGGYYYGFPVIDSLGHKTARHDLGDIVADPAAVNRGLQPADQADCRGFLTTHLPCVEGPLLAHKVCLYTLTPDHHFIIDGHPRHPEVAIAAGFSGHGFKFAPVVGEILADLVEHGKAATAIEMFSLDRPALRNCACG